MCASRSSVDTHYRCSSNGFCQSSSWSSRCWNVLGVLVSVGSVEGSLICAGRGSFEESKLCVAGFTDTGIMPDILVRSCSAEEY
jgi:hypothetical protein